MGTMVKMTIVVHPRGLGPKEAGKAWYLRKQQKMKWKNIWKVVKTMEGKRPESYHAVRNAVARVHTAGPRGFATTKYKNCGRRYGADGGKYMITPKQEKEVVHFVQQWRNKRFCTCKYIQRELKLVAVSYTHLTLPTILRV